MYVKYRKMQIEKINTIVEPAINGMGYELSDIEVKQHGREKLLRLFIDKPDGISLDDCESVSRQVSLLLDVEDPISEDYVLEISSPGLNRTLKKHEHYQKFLNSEVKIKLLPTIEGRRNYRGRLVSASKDQIVVEVDNEKHTIAMRSIENTRLVPEL